jgi:tRNA modification GTPase
MKGIILWFPGPESYTGEDMAEIQVHGSKAVIEGSTHFYLKNRKLSFSRTW